LAANPGIPVAFGLIVGAAVIAKALDRRTIAEGIRWSEYDAEVVSDEDTVIE
jgi:hypothetical protein